MSFTIAVIVFSLACIAEIFCVYRFMYKDKSLKWKTVTSTVFIIAGAAAFVSTLPTLQSFAVTMLAGLVASWIGDVTLGINLFGMKGIVGIVFFMAAHFIYISAFAAKLKNNYGLPLFSLAQIIPWAILLAIAVIFFIKTKFKFGATFIPVVLYAAVICFMVSKALVLSYKILSSSPALALILSAGSVMFLLSDMGVCSMMFGGKTELPIAKKVYSLDNFNLVTYYGAQTLLAASIILEAL